MLNQCTFPVKQFNSKEMKAILQQTLVAVRQLIFKSSMLIPLVIVMSLLHGCISGAKKLTTGKLPDEIVYARSKDTIANGGVIYTAPKPFAKSIAIIWIHGWGVNFYQPQYVKIGRALAEQGYTCITANTRMHDLGNVEGYRGDKRIRGGGYWGVASEEVRDIAAWIDFAESRGYKQMVLVGHSSGWAAVRRYQAEKQDKRVIGLVCASGSNYPSPKVDSAQLVQAIPLMAADKGDELIKDPKRSFPSYISAATFMDIANTPPEYKDFFGFNTPNAGITKIHCPILAFFGTNGDVGNEAELEKLQSIIKRQPTIQIKFTTTMIKNADHMYTGEEALVAETIVKWADTLVSTGIRQK